MIFGFIPTNPKYKKCFLPPFFPSSPQKNCPITFSLFPNLSFFFYFPMDLLTKTALFLAQAQSKPIPQRFPSQASESLIAQCVSALDSHSIPVLHPTEATQPDPESDPEEHSNFNASHPVAQERYSFINSQINKLPQQPSYPTTLASLKQVFNTYNNIFGEIAPQISPTYRSYFYQVQGQLAKDYRTIAQCLQQNK